MGFVTDAVGLTGSGPTNNFKATAPINSFTAKAATLPQSNYGGTIDQAAQNALSGQGVASGTISQEQDLARQLQQQAAGQGPNPALEQLRQTTQQQQQQAASFMASQRGINPAMAARLTAQNQAAQGQQAAGQAATLAAQQQLAAQSMQGNVLNQAGALQLGQQAGNTNLYGTAGGLQQGQNAINVQNSLGTQQLNAAVAAQNAQMNLGAQQINAGVAGQNAQTNANIVGGLMQGGGAALGFLAHGGVVPQRMAGGGIAGTESLPWYGIPQYGNPNDTSLQQGMSALGTGVNKAATKDRAQGNPNSFPNSPMMSAQPVGSPYSSPWPGADPLLTPAMARGGQVGPSGGRGPASHLGRFLAGHQATASTKPHVEALAKLAKGGVLDYRAGGELPGRAPVQGDSAKNDTVPIMGSPGEVMLPRSVTMAPDAPNRAADFVRRLQRRSGKSKGYERVAKARKGAA